MSHGIKKDLRVSGSTKAMGICSSSRGKHWTQLLRFLEKACKSLSFLHCGRSAHSSAKTFKAWF